MHGQLDPHQPGELPRALKAGVERVHVAFNELVLGGRDASNVLELEFQEARPEFLPGGLAQRLAQFLVHFQTSLWFMVKTLAPGREGARRLGRRSAGGRSPPRRRARRR